jgi:hypothetical protein
MQGGVSSWRWLGAPLATAQGAEQARGPWSLQTGLSSGTEVLLKAAGQPHALHRGEQVRGKAVAAGCRAGAVSGSSTQGPFPVHH